MWIFVEGQRTHGTRILSPTKLLGDITYSEYPISALNLFWPNLIKNLRQRNYTTLYYLKILGCSYLGIDTTNFLSAAYFGIHCKMIPDWIKPTPSRIIFSAQYITKIEILIGEVFRKYHIVIRQPLIVIASIVLVLESLLDPITLSNKSPQPKSRAEHTDFNRLLAY